MSNSNIEKRGEDTRAFPCVLNDNTDVKLLLRAFGVTAGTVVRIEYEALIVEKKLASWTRDLIFALGSLDCILVLICKSIPQAVRKLASKGLIEFFSEYLLRGREIEGMFKPSIDVIHTNGFTVMTRYDRHLTQH